MPSLTWIGKDKVVSHHQEVPYKVLEHKYGYCFDDPNDTSFAGGDNKIIHGDNLEALKSLLPEYQGRVDCIYIDPPYNTGNKTWVYNDNVDDPKIQAWMGKIVGKEGEDLSRHDKWLCMMYPRLKLLKQLLSPRGVIFISIDDCEQAYLKVICDEIFGSKNFISEFIWHSEGHSDNQDEITNVHEYILCYANRISSVEANDVVDSNVPEDSKIVRDFAENSITKNGAKNPPSWIMLPKGFPCEVETLTIPRTENIEELERCSMEVGYISRQMTKNLQIKYPARNNDMLVSNYALSEQCMVFSGWMNPSKLKQFIENGFQPIQEDGGTLLRFFLSKNGVIYYRREGRKSKYIQTVLENMGTTETNKYMLEKMGVTFDFPKPVELIKYLLSIYSYDDSIILDSFAGSGTTAHASLELNNEDEGTRKFILIEMEDYADYGTAKRVKNAISGYSTVKGLGGSFDYYELGEKLFNEDGTINPNVSVDKVREYIYYSETRQRIEREKCSDDDFLLGINNDTAYYLYYKPGEITTLSINTLNKVSVKAESYVIYADSCTLSRKQLEGYNITFKQLPQRIIKL